MDLKALNEEGHWYTSFPSLNHWTEAYGPEEYSQDIQAFKYEYRPLALYLHVPFCAKLCYYCICNIIVTNNRERIETFLKHLIDEIHQLRFTYPSPHIREMQFGGGTPSHLSQDQFKRLCETLGVWFDLKKLDEVAMEIDPRTVSQDDLRFYASQGVTRISFGIQDFDPKVQEAINRIQPYEMVAELLTPEIRSLFNGVNFDLLYGLPFQTQKTLEDTIEKVKHFQPERITLLKYCHVPEVRAHMKLIKESDLPPRDELPLMFVQITNALLDSKYEWIGLDHFAKSTDSLAIAAKQGTVGRTFNGFTPGRTRDLIGIGPTTTGAFGRSYAQAEYDLHKYYQAISRNEFPILRGYRLTDDDLKRREVIFSLLCNQKATVSPDYFGKELMTLKEHPELAEVVDGEIRVSSYGRLFLRNLCKLFDNKDVLPEHHKIAQKSMTRRAA